MALMEHHFLSGEWTGVSAKVEAPIIREKFDTGDRLDTKRLAVTATVGFLDQMDAGHKANLRNAMKKLEHTIAKDMPACVDCESIDIQCQRVHSFATDEDRYQITAGCKQGGSGQPTCPKRRRYEVESLPPDITPAVTRREAMQHFDPDGYTRAKTLEEIRKNPDKPQTIADAW